MLKNKSFKKNRKILIIGAGGFIGSYLSNFFLKKKFSVIGIDNLSRNGSSINIKKLKANKKFKFYKIDIRDFKKIKSFFLKNNNFKSILLLAGQVSLIDSVYDPVKDFEINAKGTLNILEGVKQYSRNSNFIFSSTNKVYGDLGNIKLKKKGKKLNFIKFPNGIDEKFNLNFCGPYGCSKGSAESYVRDYSKLYNLKTYVLRKSCIYGDSQFGIEGQGWISWIIIASILDKQITIYGDGNQSRDILHVEDLSKLYFKISNLKNKLPENTFNVGGGKKNIISINELIKILKKNRLLRKSLKYETTRPADQKLFYSNNNLLFKKFNWKPKISYKDGIKKMINNYLKSKKILDKVY